MESKFVWLIVAVAIYWIGCALVGLWSYKQKINEPADFFLAGRTLGPVVLSLAMMATVFSAWFILGHQGLTYQSGFPYIAHYAHIPLMAMIGILIFTRQWALGRKFGFMTPSEMFGAYYGGELIRILALAIAIIYSIPYVALQLRGAGYVFNTLSRGVIDPLAGSILLGSVIIIYVFLGGIRSAAITNSLQGLLLWVGGFLLAVTVVGVLGKASTGAGALGTWYQGFQGLGANYVTLPKAGEVWGWPYILTIALATSGIYMSPAFTVWSFTAASPKIFKFQGFFVMALAMGLMYYVFSPIIGVGSRSIILELANVDSLTPSLIFQYMPTWAFVITSLGILAAMNSTADSYLAAVAGILSRDLYLRYINKTATTEQQVKANRGMVLVMILISFVFTMFVLDYLVLLGTLATAFGLLLMPAILGVTYMPKITRAGVNAGLIAGIITIILTYFVWRHPLGIHTGGWGFIVNWVFVIVVSAFSEKPSAEMIERFHGTFEKRNTKIHTEDKVLQA